MTQNNPLFENFEGLTSEEAERLKKSENIQDQTDSKNFGYFHTLQEIVLEPMFLLLFACATIYFILKEYQEAWFMSGAILLVAAISLYQEIRQKKALDALKQYAKKKQKVRRDGKTVYLDTEDLVTGDIVICKEGDLIPADGDLLTCPDFSVNESLLTGESLPVFKDMSTPETRLVFQGSMVTSGQCIFTITATGLNTRLGKMGQKMDEMLFKKSPLQVEINSFVTKMAITGTLFFFLIVLITYIQQGLWTESLLAGLTIAMSVLPEEIPVAYTTFMALGAWRLIKKGIIVKKTDIVEALGNTRFLCLDKTGTITQNKMDLVAMYDFQKDKIVEQNEFKDSLTLLEYALWSSETEPFDPMEKTIHEHYKQFSPVDERKDYTMIHEYPLEGSPPSMTHVFQHKNGNRLAAIKGAPEAVFARCRLTPEVHSHIQQHLKTLTEKGFRVLGVGKAQFVPDKMPEKAEGFSFDFCGLVAFFDPPKEGIETFFDKVKRAGVQIKMITGDNEATATYIASQSGMADPVMAVSMSKMLEADEPGFEKMVLDNNVFARISPEIKLRIIEVLNRHGIVAMTGDGVNDGLALKAATVGIAMGKKGTEIARLASSIIITDDKPEKIYDAIETGRKIYFNLQKAIRYIISIHVPIILVVSVPLFLGWEYASIFSPVHIIFMELVMGPTCSIVYENESAEPGLMSRPPEPRGNSFISLKNLSISIIQGLVITLFALGVYRWGLYQNWTEDTIRTMVFLLLITANIFLSLANRSFYHSMFLMMKTKNELMTYILGATILCAVAILTIPAVSTFFQVIRLPYDMILSSIGLGLLSVFWFEVYKWYLRAQQ